MFIVGPTAVGKTSFAIKLAQQLRTEIISADSRQCYKELNIGVAKPNEDELKTVHHYFINSHSIHEEINAGTFEQYALQSAQTIFQKNKTAVMVGGTGLYVKAFCEGIDEIPKAEESFRKKIQQQYELNGFSGCRMKYNKRCSILANRGTTKPASFSACIGSLGSNGKVDHIISSA